MFNSVSENQNPMSLSPFVLKYDYGRLHRKVSRKRNIDRQSVGKKTLSYMILYSVHVCVCVYLCTGKQKDRIH